MYGRSLCSVDSDPTDVLSDGRVERWCIRIWVLLGMQPVGHACATVLHRVKIGLIILKNHTILLTSTLTPE